MAYGRVKVDQIESSTKVLDVDDLATTDVATSTEAGLLSAGDKVKLDGIEANAEVNVQADWTAASGDAAILNKPTLGTAAAEDVGTSAGDVVQLDELGRLPAVDGSLLTNLPAQVDALGDLSDVDLTTTPPGDGEALVYDDDSGNWVPGAAGASAAGAVGDLQFNNGTGGLGASSDLNWDDTGKVLDVGGDINLDDGGANQTTLQLVTPTAARTITFPDATGTVGLVAGSTGQLVFNNAGAYSGLSGVTTDGTDITLTGRFISSLNGAASAPPGTFTGTWFTGGTATTTKPQVLIEPTGTTSTAWSTSGTGLGVNAASGFAGNLLDLQVNGTSRLSTTSAGLTVSTTGFRTQLSGGNGYEAYWGAAFKIFDIFSNDGSVRLRLDSGGIISWNSALLGVTTPDLFIARDAANTLAQRNGTNAQTSRVYGTYTDASNYVRAALSSTSTGVTLAAETAGTGADDIPLNLTAAGTGTVKVNSNLEITDAKDIVLATVTGTKIGTATTQKLGFYNATPVVQPAAVADITTTATAGTLPTPDGTVTIADADVPTVGELLEYCVELEAKLEAALGHLRTLGLIAT
jgi:hypothetical protein